MQTLKTGEEFLETPGQKQETIIDGTQPNLFGTSSKTLFLDSLRSRGKYKYSRYKGLPLRYAGGKSLGVGYILEQFPDGLKRLASPFMGGGAVEIASAKELGNAGLRIRYFRCPRQLLAGPTFVGQCTR